MSDRAEFELILVDKYTKEAKKIARENRRLERQLEREEKARQRRNARISNAKSRANAKALAALAATQERYNRDLMKGAKAAALFAGKMALIGGAGVLVGGTLLGRASARRIEETEATVFALDRLTDHGEKTFGEISSLAQQLGLDIDDTAHSFANFLKLQFPESEAKKLIKLGADMQALGNSADDIQGIFRALGQIKSKGRVQAEEVLQLAERGVSQGLLYTAIAENRGIEDPAGQAARTEVLGLQQQGKITAAEFFVAFEEAINKKLNQSKAGEAAASFVANTFRGSRGQLQARAKNFWIKIADMAKPGLKAGFDRLSASLGRFFENTAHVETLERVMGGLGTAFELTGDAIGYLIPVATEAADVFQNSFAEAFSDVSGESLTAKRSLEAIKDLINKMIPAAELLGKALGAVAGAFSRIGQFQDAISTFIGGRSEVDIAAEQRAQMKKLIAEEQRIKAEEAGLATGAAWGDGLGAGILSKSDKVYMASIGLGNLMDEGGRVGIDAHSPSRKARKLGQFWGQGLNMGMEDESPEVILPGGGNISSLKPAGSMGGAGSSVSVGDITIMVDGSGDPEATARATYRVFKQNLDGAMAELAGEAAA